jgi:hypothetical protein
MDWERFRNEKGQHLQQAFQILEGAWDQGRLPNRDELPNEVVVTVLGALFLANFVFVLLVPKGRKLVWLVTETVLASILLVVLASVVLGLPFGKCSKPGTKHVSSSAC